MSDTKDQKGSDRGSEPQQPASKPTPERGGDPGKGKYQDPSRLTTSERVRSNIGESGGGKPSRKGR